MAKGALAAVVGAMTRLVRAHAVDCGCRECGEIDGMVAQAEVATRRAAKAGARRKASRRAGRPVEVIVDGVSAVGEIVPGNRR